MEQPRLGERVVLSDNARRLRAIPVGSEGNVSTEPNDMGMFSCYVHFDNDTQTRRAIAWNELDSLCPLRLSE